MLKYLLESKRAPLATVPLDFLTPDHGEVVGLPRLHGHHMVLRGVLSTLIVGRTQEHCDQCKAI